LKGKQHIKKFNFKSDLIKKTTINSEL
jgi:hypothetical protein